MNVDPDVFITIGICMANNNKDLISGCGVFYVKGYFGFKPAAPGLSGDSYVFFKYIYRSAGGKKRDVRDKKYKVRNIISKGLFQVDSLFLQR
jgi:hypothetical protein